MYANVCLRTRSDAAVSPVRQKLFASMAELLGIYGIICKFCKNKSEYIFFKHELCHQCYTFKK